MKKLFIALFVSLMLVGCANPAGDVGPQTKTITVVSSLNYPIKLNEQTIGVGGILGQSREIVLELGKTYDLFILDGDPSINRSNTVWEHFIECNADINEVFINSDGSKYTCTINGNTTDGPAAPNN